MMLHNSYVNMEAWFSSGTDNPKILMAEHCESLLCTFLTFQCRLGWEEVTLLSKVIQGPKSLICS